MIKNVNPFEIAQLLKNQITDKTIVLRLREKEIDIKILDENKFIDELKMLISLVENSKDMSVYTTAFNFTSIERKQ